MTKQRRILTLLLLVPLAACTNSLKVSGDFPPPLINPVPLSLGVVYPSDFKSYTYTEKSKDRSKWIIETGQAQQQLFNTVLPGLFQQVNEVDSLPTPEKPAVTDLVLVPIVKELQYSVPRETRFKIYEVWVKYNLSLYDAQGQLVADWIVTAYGKTPTAFMKSGEEAMNAAMVVALRDLGANLSLGTLRVPEIKAWLQDNIPVAPSATQEDKA